MKRPVQALRQLSRQWNEAARDAERRAAPVAVTPATRLLLTTQARSRRACAEDLTRVLNEVGLT